MICTCTKNRWSPSCPTHGTWTYNKDTDSWEVRAGSWAMTFDAGRRTLTSYSGDPGDEQPE